MIPSQSARVRVPRRTPRACRQCRAAKVRCSGILPCSRCSRRRDDCVFPEDDPKVAVSEKYLLELERRVSQAELPKERASSTMLDISSEPTNDNDCQTEVASSADVDWDSSSTLIRSPNSHPPQIFLSEKGDHNAPAIDRRSGEVFTCNPLVQDSPWIRDPHGRYRYMGPTSTWSFFRRVVSLVERRHPIFPGTPFEPLNTDGTAFRLRWSALPADQIPEIGDLPPPDHAMYLFHTVQFHLGQLFPTIHEPVFLHRLNQFETDPLGVCQTQRLWLAQYLLVLAFGEAFLSRDAQAPAPVGSAFAARAMALLPDVTQFHDEGLLAIEVLAMAALYFHSIDMRVSAFQYIGQALRLCYVEGLHREIHEDHGTELSHHCRNLWWTVYILDRRLSSLMGAPSSIRDEDITMVLPSVKDTSIAATATTLTIKLSRLLAQITTTVYGVNTKLGGSFVKNTKIVIKSLAEVAQEIESTVLARTATAYPSRVVSAVTLMYHHCILQATRPLVMCLLKGFLSPTTTTAIESTQHQQQHSEVTWISPPIVALLKTSVSSALMTLKLLCRLREHRLLEPFLPFDLEYAFSAATLLCIVQTVLPGFIEDAAAWRGATDSLLDIMAKQGSVAAGLRQSEWSYLQQLLAALCPSGPVSEVDGGIQCPVAVSANGDPLIEDDVHGCQGLWSAEFEADSMMSAGPDHLFDLVAQLGADSEIDIIGNL